MRRLAVLVSCATLALAAVSADAADPSFRQGVAAGEMTTTSAILWTRAPRPGAVLLTVSTSTSVPVGRFAIRATRANDLTVQRVVRRLKAGTRYRYFFTQGKAKSAIGSFTTAPAAGVPASVRFAISGDADATPGPNGGPAFNRYEVYQRMRAEANHFNINLGDTIYSDSEVGGTPVARTVPEKWAKYRLGLALPALWALRASAGLYSHWDDHEFINDFSRPEHGDAIYAAGVKAFRDYSPVTYSPATGLYRTFRWGKHLELFFLDERSFRSAKVTQICAGDLAPTAPQAVRNAFASLAPPSPQPGSARLSRRDRGSGANDARSSPARRVPPCAPIVDRDLEGDRERGSDPAVLRAPVRPLGGVRGRARAAPAVPPRREERRLPHDRHAWEPRQRGALQVAERDARRATGSGRSSPARSPRTRSRRRSTTSSARKAPAQRSVRSSSSPRRRTGWACAAPRSTRTATRR